MEEPGQLKRALIDSLSGAVAGGLSRTVTSPLDVIKIRFQVQLEPTSSWVLHRSDMYGSSKYTGILQATKDIYREEGLQGFWRGNVPALLLYMPYTAIQFTTLHKLKTLAAGSSKTDDHLKLSPYLSYVSGALAGCAATIGSYPFDLVRTILASQGEPKVYPTMRSAFLGIVKARGLRGLYAGLSPTLVEIIPYAGLQFGTYDTFKRWMMAWNKYKFTDPSTTMADNSLSSFQLFLCGLAAGTCAKAICHPLDVVKKRFQALPLSRATLQEHYMLIGCASNRLICLDGFICSASYTHACVRGAQELQHLHQMIDKVEGLPRHPKYGARLEPHTYKNMYHALREILHKEGLPGLYKGIFPSLIKSAPAGAVTFVAYEFASDWLEYLLA